jgi:gamma-glutamyltranspeptidase/glutathione hydrolase
MPQAGIDSVTVPGVVAGWAKAHGRVWKASLEGSFHARNLLRRPWLSRARIDSCFLGRRHRTLKQRSRGRKVYLPGGKVPEIGEMFRNPDLAKPCAWSRQKAPMPIIKGEIAQSIVSYLKGTGRNHASTTSADFSRRSGWNRLHTTYREWTVYELPPNGQGMAALEMLNIMETAPPSSPRARLASPSYIRR